MARKSREEKTIDHGEIVVDDLKKLYTENSTAFIEYEKLFKEYKKISKRFNKTLNISDTVGKGVLDDNEKLQDNLEYTIEKARDKILYNIEEHRKTKEVLAKATESERETINRLKRELRDLRQYTVKLEHELNKESDLSHEFYETEDIVKPNEINPTNLHNKSFEKIVQQYLDKGILPTTIAKITVDDFKNQYSQIKDFGSDKVSILKVFYKFFSSTIGTKHIVYYFGNNVFYIFFNKHTVENTNELIKLINVPRKISNVTFTFSIGITELQNESYNTFIQRLDSSNDTASKNQASCSSNSL